MLEYFLPSQNEGTGKMIFMRKMSSCRAQTFDETGAGLVCRDLRADLKTGSCVFKRVVFVRMNFRE